MRDKQLQHIAKLIRQEMGLFYVWSIREDIKKRASMQAAMRVTKYLKTRNKRQIALLADKLLIALADAIRRPMGVIPDSAKGLVTTEDLEKAERRRRDSLDETL